MSDGSGSRDPGLGEVAAAPSKVTGATPRETAAELAGGLWLVGPFLKAYIKGDPTARRMIVWGGVLLFVYPLLTIFSALTLIRVSPALVRDPAQRFILDSVGYTGRGEELRLASIKNLNASHNSIDGSLQMTFNMDDAESGDGYYFDVQRHQPVSFRTFQIQSSRLLKDATCTDVARPSRGEIIGRIIVRFVEAGHREIFQVPTSLGGISRLERSNQDSNEPDPTDVDIDKGVWKKIDGEEQRVPLQIYFEPDRDIAGNFFKCYNLDVYVTMTFRKIPQPETGK